MKPPVLAVVAPCYNEQEVLPETVRRLRQLLERLVGEGRIDAASRIWLVDDGSRDATWSLIRDAGTEPGIGVCGIKLSRNRGHQIALLAGLLSATGDVIVSVDADLQDDLEAIPRMLDAHAAGHDIVYGVRSSRATDTAFKRFTAEGYYRLLDRLGVEVIFNHADYRLMSRRAIEALRAYPETNVFLRGLIPQLGFPSTTVEYARAERFAGESKYPLRKMLQLAWQGVTSFSAAPLRAITTIGLLVSVLSLGLGFWALFVRLFTDEAVPGWASIVIPLFLISGVQLLSLGVIGEYLAKVFVETKRRPLYFVDQMIVAPIPGRDAAAPDPRPSILS
ncbi:MULTISPECIES: glycosyltransferase family 2 protein [unclassified Rubrivivax]|uniref:glycosyltransferase family 2 protein n=1 Tax=unclassified Rubrivivax TaxID=2649762 RepID=UPI001E3AD04C|nr:MULTISPECIES: glycosyltransferase family 2 protein [unclassified Rubrivivax]MCC9596334.1 glycosyltransferase family 2 protein [Rubrivivax sp. JA1055]MCC9647325.1 glycosyltransferase family 2 protein [Rubrivivax sp. JA1029]